MIVTIYDYSGKAKNVELKNEVKRMSIRILSGDEILEVEYVDGTFEEFDSCDFRDMNFFDGFYFLNEKILKDEEWLNSNDSYYRLSRA